MDRPRGGYRQRAAAAQAERELCHSVLMEFLVSTRLRVILTKATEICCFQMAPHLWSCLKAWLHMSRERCTEIAHIHSFTHTFTFIWFKWWASICTQRVLKRTFILLGRSVTLPCHTLDARWGLPPTKVAALAVYALLSCACGRAKVNGARAHEHRVADDGNSSRKFA